MNYRKKPVVIQALQYTGDNVDEIIAFIGEGGSYDGEPGSETLKILTLEGEMTASVNDWIIRGVKGEFYPCKPDVFAETYDVDQGDDQPDTAEKTLHNTTADGAKDNVSDLVIWGDGDMFKLLSKASSQKEGWMKSTKAMEIEGVGCLVQVTTQQRGLDGTYAVAEALTMVHGVQIEEGAKGPDSKPLTRKLVKRTQ